MFAEMFHQTPAACGGVQGQSCFFLFLIPPTSYDILLTVRPFTDVIVPVVQDLTVGLTCTHTHTSTSPCTVSSDTFAANSR